MKKNKYNLANISRNVKDQIVMCLSVTLNGDSWSPGATLEWKQQFLLIPSDGIDLGGDLLFTYTGFLIDRIEFYAAVLFAALNARVGVDVNE